MLLLETTDFDEIWQKGKADLGVTTFNNSTETRTKPLAETKLISKTIGTELDHNSQ